MICLDKNDNSKDLIQQIQTFIFDCDGVLWAGKTKINGAGKVIKMLKKKINKYYMLQMLLQKQQIF